MSNIQYTAEQLRAIEAEGSNILVSAAAGCGKTTLMIERIIRKVLKDNISIDKIIVVTFTEAAAAELKERLEVALNNRLLLDKDNSFLKRQLSLLNDAYISTFHSLCLRLLEENGVAFNYNDSIKIGDTVQITNIKQQAFSILDKEASVDKEYLLLKDYYTSIYDDSNLFRLLDNTLELCITKGSIKEFESYNNDTLPIKNIFDYPLFNALQNEASKLSIDNIILLFEQAQFQNNTDKVEQEISEALQLFYELKTDLANQDYNNLHTKINNYKIFRKPVKGKENKNEVMIFNHSKIKTEFEKQLKPLYKLSNDEYLKSIEDNKTNTKNILKYTKKYFKILDTIKKDLGILEFNDLEQEALRLLYDENDNESDVALSLKKQFNEIMIDEYQDTNIIQERIVSALASGSNTFMVGDLKQSIYRFRNATPQLFSFKYDQYSKNNGGEVIDLSFNFRSKNEVLETANYIFKSVFSANIGGIEYDSKNQLYFKNEKLNEFKGNYTTKLFYNVYTKEDDNSPNSLYKATAKGITNEIKKLIASGINYNQIAILFKTRTRSSILTSLLKQENIPYMIHDNSGFYAAYEIKDLLNLLKALINRNDDIALLGALRSYFFNLNENDLLKLSLLEGSSYYQKLKNSEYVDTFELLNDLIYYSNNHRPLEVINYIYEKTNYLSYLHHSNNYEQVLINITSFKKILEDNIDYYNSLEYLISELDYNIARNFDTAKPATLSSKEDVVNIMTIHKSKGLEFDYVFLFDESKIMFETSQDATKVKNLDKQLVFKYFDTKTRIYSDNPLNNLISFNNKKEVLAEELRVLYVALTRAKLQLYIFKNIEDIKLEEQALAVQNNSDWLIDEYNIINLKSMLEAVIISFIRHKNGLQLRDSISMSANEDIYNYYGNLFEVKPYDYSLLEENIIIEQDKNIYPIKTVARIQESTKTIEQIKPSKYNQAPLDFEKISDFDTYEQGNNVHKVLELLDFDNPQLDKLFNEYSIYDRNKEGIKAFISSEIFSVIKDNTYYKEYSFSYLDNDELFKGIIDLFVELENDIYIIDYKTDMLTEKELIESYSKQLNTYENVISKTSTKKISKYIYSLYNKKFIKL